ncbi:hypothetical protein GGU11DRAFT_761539 [Lentinula aff. detonsa]|nr:hypothetical protein GGU11DRAFT_761539 [Lentinula aff. detonsa]
MFRSKEDIHRRIRDHDTMEERELQAGDKIVYPNTIGTSTTSPPCPNNSSVPPTTSKEYPLPIVPSNDSPVTPVPPIVTPDEPPAHPGTSNDSPTPLSAAMEPATSTVTLKDNPVAQASPTPPPISKEPSPVPTISSSNAPASPTSSMDTVVAVMEDKAATTRKRKHGVIADREGDVGHGRSTRARTKQAESSDNRRSLRVRSANKVGSMTAVVTTKSGKGATGRKGR